MLHILHAVETERNEGTAGAQEETDEGSHDEREAPALVGDIGGDLVTVGANNGDWSGSKHHLVKYINAAGFEASQSTVYDVCACTIFMGRDISLQKKKSCDMYIGSLALQLHVTHN